MYQVTNTSETPRIIHDRFGRAHKIMGGKTVTMELADSIVSIFEGASGRGEPIHLRLLAPEEVLAYEPAALSDDDPNAPPKMKPQPSAAELLPQLADLSYDELLGHIRALMGEAYDLGPRPKKLLVQARLRDMAEKQIIDTNV